MKNRKKVYLLLGLILICIVFFCYEIFNFTQNKSSGKLNISIIELIANPTKYHKKKIRVIGVGNLEFEGNAIYLSKDDLEYRISKNAIWIELDESIIYYNDVKQFNGKYVIVEGIFDKNDKGHFSLFSGSLKEVYLYEIWNDMLGVN